MRFKSNTPAILDRNRGRMFVHMEQATAPKAAPFDKNFTSPSGSGPERNASRRGGGCSYLLAASLMRRKLVAAPITDCCTGNQAL